MLILSTTGYIITCLGPFFFNAANNDASIMNRILAKNSDNILNWLKEDDILVVDRGFRDSICATDELGLELKMPPFLNRRRQFSSDESNQSRCITKIRWVVEAVNGRLKQFKFFSNTVQNSSLPHLEAYMLIACSLINRYWLPMTTSTTEMERIAQQMLSSLNKNKAFEQFLQRNQLIRFPTKWENIDHQDILTVFLILCEGDIGDITLGMFQLKRARSYAEERCSTTDLTGDVDYPLQRSKDYPNIIRIPTQSAHSVRITYHPTIEFSLQQILNWWCDCKIGNRFVGCCSHIASAIWFLSFKRWQTEQRRMSSGDYIKLFDDAHPPSDFVDTTDDEE